MLPLTVSQQVCLGVKHPPGVPKADSITVIFFFHGLSPRANYTERPPLVGEVIANLCG
jgi:hypothetical protein